MNKKYLFGLAFGCISLVGILFSLGINTTLVKNIAGALIAGLGGTTTPTEFATELSTTQTVPVVVVNYFTVGTSVTETQILKGDLAHKNYAGQQALDTGPLAGTLVKNLVPRSVKGAQNLADFITESTIYRGYKAGMPQTPALRFKIVDTVTILQRKDDPAFSDFPIKNANLGYKYFPDINGYARGTRTNSNPNAYRDPLPYIFDRIDICKYIAGDPGVFSDPTKAAPVRMILFQNPSQTQLNGVESTGAGPYGFLGNNPDTETLFCAGGSPLPVASLASADAMYHVVGYHPVGNVNDSRPTGNSVEDFMHHYESLFNHFSDGDFTPGTKSAFAGDMIRYPSFTALDESDQIPAGGFKDFPEFGIRVTSVRTYQKGGFDYGDFIITSLPGATIPGRTFSSLLQGGDHIVRQLGVPFTLKKGGRVVIAGKDLFFIAYDINSVGVYATIYHPGDQFGLVRRCGWAHAGPNAEGNYDWGQLFYKVRTDCEDWTPDESGEILSNINCTRWALNNPSCDPDPSATYRGVELDIKKYVMQNIPGLNNDIAVVKDGKVMKMRNLWGIISDYVSARKRSEIAYYDTGERVKIPVPLRLSATYTPTTNTVVLSWTAPPGITSFNIFRKEMFHNGEWSEFHRVNDSPVRGTSFVDGESLPLIKNRSYIYEVRSLQTSPRRLQSEEGASAALINGAAVSTEAQTLALRYGGTGRGYIYVVPNISGTNHTVACFSSCVTSVSPTEAISVTITPEPDPGSVFAGLVDEFGNAFAACPGQGSCTITSLATSTEVVAIFNSTSPNSGTISGTVNYFSNNIPVPNVTVTLDKVGSIPQSFTTQTDIGGNFTFSGVPIGRWALSYNKKTAASDKNSVAALDAVLALQSTVGAVPLPAEQVKACDTNNNGSITAIDVSRILQYRTQLIPFLPVSSQDTSGWGFNSTTTTLTINSGTSHTTQVSAYFLGDCDGNWGGD